MQTILLWILKFLLERYLGMAEDEVRALFKERMSKKQDEQTAVGGVEEIQKPHDPSLPVEQREKLEEAAFEKFRNRFRRRR